MDLNVFFFKIINKSEHTVLFLKLFECYIGEVVINIAFEYLRNRCVDSEVWHGPHMWHTAQKIKYICQCLTLIFLTLNIS